MKPYRLVAFKKNGVAHRMWQRIDLIKETDDYFTFASLYPSITESSGRIWSNEEPTLYFCHKREFYNVLVMFKTNGTIAYYVNIASPTTRIDEYAYGFIDFDLDVKMQADKTISLLDEEEFKNHASFYGYSDNLIEVTNKTVLMIKDMMKSGEGVFDDRINRNLLDEYRKKRVLK